MYCIDYISASLTVSMIIAVFARIAEVMICRSFEWTRNCHILHFFVFHTWDRMRLSQPATSTSNWHTVPASDDSE
jgi:hypothetical protein